MRAIRLLVVGGLLVAGVAVGASAASADGTPTSFGFGVSGDSPPLSLLNPTVTFSGTLWNAQANTPITVPEPVTITEQVAGTGPAVTVASVNTDTSGNFTVTTGDLTGGGTFTANFAGDAANGYAAGSSSPVTVEAAGSETTVILTTAPKSLVAAGAAVTFAGKAYVPGNGKQLPVPDARATLYRNAVATSVTAPVKANGTFSLSVKPTSKANWWVEVDPVSPPWPYALYLYGTSRILTIHAVQVDRTRVSAIDVPATQDIYRIGLSGTVQALAGTVWRPAASVSVSYYFRVLPKGSWRLAGSSKTNGKGAFRWAGQDLSPLLGVRFHGHLAWQARVANGQVAGNSEYLGSVSAVRDSYAADGTFIGDFHAQYSHGTTWLEAVVEDHSDASPHVFPTGTAKFYYLPAGSKTWRYLGSASTFGGGGVVLPVNGALHGHVRVVFPTQGHYLGSSAELYLR
jgi:hypothetical protein